MATSAPKPRQAAAIRVSSVAIQTDRAALFWQRSQTCWINGLPSISISGLPGSRVEP